MRDTLAHFEQKRPDDWGTSHARALLGGNLLGQKRHAEAEPLLKAGYEGMQQRSRMIPQLKKDVLPEAADWLVRLYQAIGKPDQVAKWRSERAKYP